MGGEQSHSAATQEYKPSLNKLSLPLPITVTDEPWRKIKGWDSSVREELREEVANFTPVQMPVRNCCCSGICRKTKPVPFNIVLTGQIKAGKSSFFNSINSLFSNRVIAGKADTGNAAASLTKELRIYEVKPSPHAASLPWRVIDTMGLDANTGEVDVRNLLKAVDGHVPNKHIFKSGEDFHQGCRGFVKNPTLAEQAHCVAVVVNANQANNMSEDMWSQLRNLRQGLISRNMPTYIILTHIDEACDRVNEDIKNVLNSIKIRDLVSKVSRKLMGLPENQIFPVKNYSNEVDLQDKMDILLLYAMRQMLYSAQAHIDNKM